jgi:hypothetical protein
LFCRELPAHRRGMHGRLIIPPGIIRSGTRKLHAHRHEFHPRNGVTPGITSSWKLIQADKLKMRKNPINRNNFQILFYERKSTINKLSTYIINKKINLILPYYDLQIYPMKQIKNTKISRYYPLTMQTLSASCRALLMSY